jgi:hypothetical protein
MREKNRTKKEDYFFKLRKSPVLETVDPADVKVVSRFCELFKSHTKDEFYDLKGDIEANNVQVPVIVKKSPDGYMVINGRGRLKACTELGITCPANVYDEELSTEEEAYLAFLGNRQFRKAPTKELQKELAFKLHDEFKWGYKRIAVVVGIEKKNWTTVRYWLKKRDKGLQICTPNDACHSDDDQNDIGQSDIEQSNTGQSGDETVRNAIAQLDKIVIKSVDCKFEEAGELFMTIRTVLEEGQYDGLEDISKDQVKELLRYINAYHEKLPEWSNVLSLLLRDEPSKTEDGAL